MDYVYVHLSIFSSPMSSSPKRIIFDQKQKRERAFVTYMEPSAEGKICLVKSVNRFAGNDQSFLLDCINL